MAKPRRDELFDIAFLQQQAERYRSAAEATACEQERNYFIVMARLPETMAVNEKMRTWLDRTIEELRTVRMGATSGCGRELKAAMPSLLALR